MSRKQLAQRPPWNDGSGSVNDLVRQEMDAEGVSYDAAAHVDAYLEYHRIVGDDGGPLLSGERLKASERLGTREPWLFLEAPPPTRAPHGFHTRHPSLLHIYPNPARDTPNPRQSDSPPPRLTPPLYRLNLSPWCRMLTPNLLLSEAEYAEFRARAVAQRADRLYVTWRNANGIDCKVRLGVAEGTTHPPAQPLPTRALPLPPPASLPRY